MQVTPNHNQHAEKPFQIGIIPIVDFGVLDFVVGFREGPAERLGARLVLDFARGALFFQPPPVEPPFLRRGFLV